ncbi:dehydrogenase [Frankia sp. AgPm24]|uniref:dehydrogenase n=1 Tax=Frankia sp. AgPm24 TaxID=631128 RepID=UPI00200FF612|nr:dehydrogenase [Frankia sp. AgPm24]MCK9921661.1 dehydrogenase [Frankia sp. AgPm24]
MTTLPELIPPRDPALAVGWRESRRTARRGQPDLPLAMALVTDGSQSTTTGVLRDAGVDVVGLLAPEPLESLAWAAEAGLHVLLAGPASPADEVLRAVADLAEEADLAHVVALDGRAWPTATHVAATVASLGRLTQVTVVGAPTGPGGRVEMVDLATRWCGEILAVCADRTAMPASALAPDAPVTLALLTASGATVLVNERMNGALDTATITVCGQRGRLVVQGRQVRHQDERGVQELVLPAATTHRPGLREATCDVVRATELEDPRLVRGATFHDLLAANRLLAAASTSHQRGGWVEL